VGVGRDGLIRRTCELLREMRPAELTRAELARQVGVDPALIRYYFKDRTSLLAAAGAALLEQLAAEYGQIMAKAGDDPVVILRGRIKGFLRFLRANPNFHRLMMDEFMHSDVPAAIAAHESLTAPTIDVVRKLILQGVDQGRFRKVDGAFVFMLTLGASEFFINASGIRRMAFGDEAESEALLTRYEDFLMDIVERGLRPGL
jgi:TetR/AcrR family transcriptional regulator